MFFDSARKTEKTIILQNQRAIYYSCGACEKDFQTPPSTTPFFIPVHLHERCEVDLLQWEWEVDGCFCSYDCAKNYWCNHGWKLVGFTKRPWFNHLYKGLFKLHVKDSYVKGFFSTQTLSNGLLFTLAPIYSRRYHMVKIKHVNPKKQNQIECVSKISHSVPIPTSDSALSKDTLLMMQIQANKHAHPMHGSV